MAGILRTCLLMVLMLAPVFTQSEAQPVGGYGTVQTRGSGTDEITLLRVGGTRYQMGYWYGYLLADEIAGCWAGLYATAADYDEATYDAATAAMWDSAHFDTAAYESELNGMADGCADAGHPEITFEILRRMQLFPDIGETSCGLFAAWGNATADGHLYQMRNLDWSMDAGIQDYPLVVIYEPDDGNLHAVIGAAGIVGAAGGGMNEHGIAVSEIMGGFGDAETLDGAPFPLLLREVLYHDTTLAEALARIENAERTNEYYYCISGPEGTGSSARLLLTSNTRFDVHAENESVDPHPYYSPFHDPLVDVVYWKNHNGSGNENLYNAINDRYGAINSEKAIEIAQADGVSSTVLSIIYDTTALKCWVACANGSTDPAHNQAYVEFDLNPVTYSLGDATELLDQAFYDGEAADGSDALGRMAFFGAVSSDGTTVAFWAVNIATEEIAVFLVDIGDPSSWRRLTPDIPELPDQPIYWTPDDLFLVTKGKRIPLSTGEFVPHTVHGYPLTDVSSTRLVGGNWLVTDWNGEIVALPVLGNGDEDPAREPVIVTDFAGAGVNASWPGVTPDGSAVAFADWHGSSVPGVADLADAYVLKNLETIIAAPKISGTDISTLAPTSLADPNIVAIRADETDNFAHTPYFSQDKSLVFYSEDWENVFRDADFFNTLLLADFDVMISNADGSGEDLQLAEEGNQGGVTPTPGGTRLLYLRDVAGVVHLYITTLEVITDVVGNTQGDPADNDITTTADQEASDASGTAVEISAGTTIDFPVGQPQQIHISTPIDPATEPELPDGVDAIPVIREFGPNGTLFDPPVTVTIAYTNAEIAGMDEANLRVFRYNPITNKYDIEITTIVERDLDNNTISFTINQFSKYGLGAATDTDGDGIDDSVDTDDDGDGIPDDEDLFPLDTDNDGVNNVDDPDDDADGIPDGDDTYPLDTDNDGRNNAEDPDDDNDGVSDALEMIFDGDPLNPGDTPALPLKITPILAALLVIFTAFRLTSKQALSPNES